MSAIKTPVTVDKPRFQAHCRHFITDIRDGNNIICASVSAWTVETSRSRANEIAAALNAVEGLAVCSQKLLNVLTTLMS